VAVDGVKPLASYHGLLIPREKPSLPTEHQAGKNTYGFVPKKKNYYSLDNRIPAL